MKKKNPLLFFLILFFFSFKIVPLYSEEKNVKPPIVEARSAILMDLKSGRVLWEKDAHTKKAMASTTKIMTCIIALENGSLHDEVSVSAKAAAAPRVKLYIKKGETYRLEDLLYALMLQSSNDVAVAIAEHIGGSVEEFCKMMTEKAKEIGAENTSYQTANGLDAQDHYSTAYDLALITQYALQNPKFMEIINTREITISNVSGAHRSFYLANANRFLTDYEGATGVKTGFTGQAGYCFVGAARQQDMHLVSVVLGSGWYPHKNQKWVDTKAIMNYGFANFKPTEIILQNQKATSVPVLRGIYPDVELVYEKGFSLPLKKDDLITTKISSPTSLEAPVLAGSKVGYGEVFVNGERYTRISLVALQNVERHDFMTSLQKILGQWMDLCQ